MPKTLLLADDSVTIQKVVGISFANEDVRLVTVDNGDDAIARVREVKPDAVLADVVMPGRSGYEVCETIKSEPELRHIPVLLLTGTFEAFDADRAQRAGADGHITKPFEAQTLVDRVNELLARAPRPAATPPAAEPAGPTGADTAEAGTGEDFLEDEPPAALVDELDAGGEEEAFVFESEEMPAEAVAGLDEAEAADPFAETASQTALLADAPDLDADDAEDATDPAVEQAMEASGPGGPVPARGPEAESERDPLEVSASGIDDLDLDLAEVPDLATPAPDERTRTTVLDPAGSDAFDVSSSDLGGMPAAAAEVDAPEAGEVETTGEELAEVRAEPEPISPPLPSVSATGAPDAPSGPVSPARAATSEPLTALPDDVRRQVLEQLEKVAWEAFGELAETLVRQTVAKVEAIAWEVVPQMAESLIREEIRRLKEDEEG